MELNLIDGNVLFVDGTIIRANAARGKNYTKQRCEKKLVEIDKNIEVLLDEMNVSVLTKKKTLKIHW